MDMATENITAENYQYKLPFDNTEGKDVFRYVPPAPEIEDVDEDFKEKHCYKNDTFIRGPYVQYPYTQEQLDEMKRCKNDSFYFIQNYVKINTLDHGVQLFEPFQYQKNMIKMMDENRFTIFTTSRQAGKCVHGDTEMTVRNKRTGDIETVSIAEFFGRFEHS